MGASALKAWPPEDFFVDRNAKSIRDYFVCGIRTEGRVGDLVAMALTLKKSLTLPGRMTGPLTTRNGLSVPGGMTATRTKA